MANEERKVRYGIKGKLISAIAMLLVAAIMTVSSTYAWFTLSTAPEVSGISTAVGANGALEMVLLSKNDGTWAYTNGSDIYGDKNTTWGNLVDLSNNANYGSNQIVLYPSVLNTSIAGKVNMASPLNFPQYGADGRVTTVNGQTQLSGNYKGTGSFVENGDYGFRAVGTTSGLSERELALRAAASQINVLKNQAQGKAEASLTAHGSTLADMAIQKVMKPAPVFGNKHYNAVAGMISGLEEALALLDEAYQQAVLAWAASNLTSSDNTVYNAVKAIVENDATYANIEAVIAAVEGKFDEWEGIIHTATQQTVTLALPTWIKGAAADGATAATALEQYKVMKAQVQAAATELAALLPDGTTVPADDAEFTYEQMTTALQPLVNMSVLKVNDLTLDQKDAIMASALNNRAVWVSMTSGSGVYADMADQCGSYKASIEVDAGSLLGAKEPIPMDAEMRAATTVGNPYLQEAINEANTAGAPSDTSEAVPFSEFYGYIIDLGFRTNAAASNLLLQQEGVDRIYSDNNNESTMGKGSTMIFESTTPSFSTDKVKALMRHIRIVFFATEGENEIYAYAKLDVDNATVSNGKVTAMMYIYETVTAYTYNDGSNDVTVFRSVVTSEGTTTYNYYSNYYKQDTSTLVHSTADAAEDATIRGVNGEKEENAKQVEVTRAADDENYGVITALTQNAVKHVSALVYLDGTTIQNSDVAADAASSMTGTANFQFASDANLVPMEYGNLHTPNATTPTTAPTTP